MYFLREYCLFVGKKDVRSHRHSLATNLETPGLPCVFMADFLNIEVFVLRKTTDGMLKFLDGHCALNNSYIVCTWFLVFFKKIPGAVFLSTLLVKEKTPQFASSVKLFQHWKFFVLTCFF